jgi:hypothetical protein
LHKLTHTLALEEQARRERRADQQIAALAATQATFSPAAMGIDAPVLHRALDDLATQANPAKRRVRFDQAPPAAPSAPTPDQALAMIERLRTRKQTATAVCAD